MTGRDRRAVTVGGAAVLGAVLALRVIPWGVRSLHAAHVNLAERTALLARAREELADQPALQDSVARVTRRVVALAPKILSGQTVAEASADLAARLTLAASRSVLRLERVTPLPDSAAGGRLRRVAAHAALEGDVRGVMRFLQAIAGGETGLTVSDLRIVAPDPASAERVAERLRMEVTVAGYFVGKRETRNGNRESAPEGSGP